MMDLFSYEVYLLRRAVAVAVNVIPEDPEQAPDPRDLSKRAREAAARRDAILAYVTATGPTTVGEICLRFNLIKVTAHNYLTTLVEQGRIVRKNYGRRARFCLATNAGIHRAAEGRPVE